MKDQRQTPEDVANEMILRKSTEEIHTKIAFLPYWVPVQEYASSRIRIALMYSAINDWEGYRAYMWQGENVMPPKSDIYIIGKSIHKGMLPFLEKEKGEGKLMVVDITDPEFNGMVTAINLADVITVPTKALKKLFLDWYGIGKPVIVSPDCIDYGLTEINKPAPKAKGVVWFGNYNTLTASRFGLWDCKLAGHVVGVITDTSHFKDPQFTRVKWKYSTFVPELRKWEVALLYHIPGSYKSDNKLLVAIACGLPVICNDGTAYADTLRKYGREEFIVKEGETASDKMLLLENVEMREAYLKGIQESILLERNYQATANNLLIDIIEFKNERKRMESVRETSLRKV